MIIKLDRFMIFMAVFSLIIKWCPGGPVVHHGEWHRSCADPTSVVALIPEAHWLLGD